MKHVSKSILCVSSLLLAVTAAKANLTSPTAVTIADQTTANIVSTVGASLASPGESIIGVLRLDNMASASSGSGFTVTYGATGNATVSWNLTGKGENLEGVFVTGGLAASFAGNLYGVTPDQEVIGSGNVSTVLNLGVNAGITSIVFLGTNVPDSGSTIALLGGALCGIGLLRKRLSARTA